MYAATAGTFDLLTLNAAYPLCHENSARSENEFAVARYAGYRLNACPRVPRLKAEGYGSYAGFAGCRKMFKFQGRVARARHREIRRTDRRHLGPGSIL